MRIVIAGSSGFIGTHLVSYFATKGHELTLLSREPKQSHIHYWDPAKQELEPQLLEGADVIINLAGESIFGRWSEKKKEQITASRIESTQALFSTISGLKVVPKVYIGASAVGYYGDRKQEVLTESSPAGSDFLAQLCKNWESIPAPLNERGVRVVAARFGTVFGPQGGALQHIEKAFKTNMGGVLGSGQQIMSWIAIDDLCSAMQHIIDHPELKGPVNFVSPNSVTNAEFTHIVGKLLHVPTLMNIPKFALTLFFGDGAESLLASINAFPEKLLSSGFSFQYPNLEDALKKYLPISV